MKTGIVFLLLLLPVVICCQKQDAMSSIKEVKRAHEARLLALPDVVSVGVGKDEHSRAAIVVGLKKANAATAAKIPGNIDGYRVIIRLTGPVKAQ